MDVPINSTYKKDDNSLEYYTSDLAEIIIFNPSEEKVDKKTQDEALGLYVHELVYEDPKLQEGGEIIGGKIYDAIHYDKKTENGWSYDVL